MKQNKLYQILFGILVLMISGCDEMPDTTVQKQWDLDYITTPKMDAYVTLNFPTPYPDRKTQYVAMPDIDSNPIHYGGLNNGLDTHLQENQDKYLCWIRVKSNTGTCTYAIDFYNEYPNYQIPIKTPTALGVYTVEVFFYEACKDYNTNTINRVRPQYFGKFTFSPGTHEHDITLRYQNSKHTCAD